MEYFSPLGKSSNHLWDSQKSARKSSDWLEKYRKSGSSASFTHDETWVTIAAFYGLFGDQSDINLPERLLALNTLLHSVYSNKKKPVSAPQFSAINGAHAEVCLPENRMFREYLRNQVFQQGAYHPYSDLCTTLRDKLGRCNASLEGNSHIDMILDGANLLGKPIHVFIEAKFMSDISAHITYLPVRNQIARNIDCVLDIVTQQGAHLDRIRHMWFILLTPGVYRTTNYGGSRNSPLTPLNPCRSRLYCYKMDDYLSPALLKQDLPHWCDVLEDKHWRDITRRIGWLTYEDIVQAVVSVPLLSGSKLTAFKEFFQNRELLPASTPASGSITQSSVVP